MQPPVRNSTVRSGFPAKPDPPTEVAAQRSENDRASVTQARLGRQKPRQQEVERGAAAWIGGKQHSDAQEERGKSGEARLAPHHFIYPILKIGEQ